MKAMTFYQWENTKIENEITLLNLKKRQILLLRKLDQKKLEIERLEYENLINEYKLDKNLFRTKNKQLESKRDCIVNILRNMEELSSDRIGLIESFIDQVENIDKLRIISEIVIMAYSFGMELIPEIFKRHFEMDKEINYILYNE
jgi:hypothetical protein